MGARQRAQLFVDGLATAQRWRERLAANTWQAGWDRVLVGVAMAE